MEPYMCYSSDSDCELIGDQCNRAIPIPKPLPVDGSLEGFCPNSPELAVPVPVPVPVDDFSKCMQQAEFWVEQVRKISKEKENAFGACKKVQNILLEECHRRDQVIQSMQRDIVQEHMHTSQQVNRLNHELHMIREAIEFYRDKLRDVNREFSEYRATHVLPDQAVVSDNPIGGKQGLGKQDFIQEDNTGGK